MRDERRVAAMAVGLKIRTARLRKGLTQQELAVRIGLSSAAVQGYETGRCCTTVDLRARIAHALSVDQHHIDPPALMEVGPDERDLLESYRRIVSARGRAGVIRAFAAIEAGRELASC